MDELVAIAKVARPHGLRGEVVADVLTDFPERFEGLRIVTGVLSDGTRRGLELERYRFQNDRVLLKFAGVDRIEDTEGLKGADICVAEAEAVELEEGEFFDWELEGCTVVTAEGDTLGVVKELLRTGGTEVLVIVGGSKEYLVPFAESICTDIDIEGKRIVIDPPEGLLEF